MLVIHQSLHRVCSCTASGAVAVLVAFNMMALRVVTGTSSSCAWIATMPTRSPRKMCRFCLCSRLVRLNRLVSLRSCAVSARIRVPPRGHGYAPVAPASFAASMLAPAPSRRMAVSRSVWSAIRQACRCHDSVSLFRNRAYHDGSKTSPSAARRRVCWNA